MVNSVTGTDSEEVPPSCILAGAISGLTRIGTPLWEAPRKTTHLYILENWCQDALVNLSSVILPVYAEPSLQLTTYLGFCYTACLYSLPSSPPPAAYWVTRMWFLPLKSPYSKCLMLYLGPKYLNVVPAGWNNDFQLATEGYLSGLLWWVPCSIRGLNMGSV